MRQSYSTRAAVNAGYSRNRNTVRHTGKSIGPISYVSIIGLLVLAVGLVYVSQGTQATNYDYELSAIEDEISELEAKKEDLAVERARLTSIASTEQSEVAANMENATVADYVAE